MSNSRMNSNFVFPVGILPPKIQSAVNEAIAVTQAPPALVVSSAFAAASLAVQTKFTVKRLNGLVSPCSLYMITFAESGERKTTVDQLFFSPFRKFEADVAQRSFGGMDEAEDAKVVLDRSMAENIRILYSDVTPSAFLAGLNSNSASAGLCDDEAGRIFSGRLIDDLGLLNKLWNGSDITVDRRNESLSIRSPRCTISWMVQPEVFRRFMNKKGEEARGIGFLARCLLCYPLTTQGTRFLRSHPDLEAIPVFTHRVMELLNDQVELLRSKNCVNDERVELSFSVSAQALWENIFNTVESSILPGGEFCEARDYASKVAENIARLAGVLHVFEGFEGTKISDLTLGAAADIVIWYAREFIRLFSPPSAHDVISDYARALDEWLIDFCKTTGLLYIPRNDLLQIGPNKLRRRDIMSIAIQRLVETNRVVCKTIFPPYDGRKYVKGTHVLELSDAYYGQIKNGRQPFGFVLL